MRIIFAAALCSFLLAAVARSEESDVSKSTSTAAAPPRTVEDIYVGAKYRDPFVRVAAKTSGVSAVAAAEWDPEDFSIHELDLRGIMRDKTGEFAILTDRVAGVGFILRQGKLYDYKNNHFKGVTGKINMAQKTVYLITAEKDVQTLRLGEEDEEDAAGE